MKQKPEKQDFTNKLKLTMGDKGIVVEGETLKKLQDVELEMLLDLIEFFKKYDVPYSLAGGSALGAVRHGGFIPWDDDIDLTMHIKDVHKFAKSALADSSFTDKYRMLIPGITQDFPYPYFLVSKKGTTQKELIDTANKGIHIDIFPTINTYDFILARKLQALASTLLHGFLSCRKYYDFRENVKAVEGDLPTMHLRIKIGEIFSFIPTIKVAKWALYFQWLCKNDNSKYIAIPFGRKHFNGELRKRSDIYPLKTILFEGHDMNIDNNYDIYLTNLYGDWRKIPEESERETHALLELDFGE
jgi:lipopolysaccharide cholinephosphotransferase